MPLQIEGWFDKTRLPILLTVRLLYSLRGELILTAVRGCGRIPSKTEGHVYWRGTAWVRGSGGCRIGQKTTREALEFLG